MRRALLFACLLAACDDDFTSEIMDAGNPGQMDASLAPRDAGMDARQVVVVDAGDPLPDYAECRGTVDGFHAARVPGRSFATAVTVDRIYVAYAIATCGGTLANSVAQGLALATMKTSGAVDPPQPWINAASEDCSRTRTPALIANRGALTAFYASDRGGSPQVWTQSDAGARALTTDIAAAPSDITVDGTRVFYARANAIQAQTPDGEPQQLVAANEGYEIGRIATSALGPSLSMVGWISQSSVRPGAYLRVVDQLPLAPQFVGAIGPQSGLALATQSKRGIVVYSDDTGCLFARTVELDKTLGEPLRLTSPNQFVRDVALTRYGLGYALAYRATPQESGSAVIRLLMIDEYGNQAHPRVISEARSDGEGLEIRVANDGRVIIAWADPGADGDIVVSVARLTCL